MSQTTDRVAPEAGSDTGGSTIDRRTWIGLVVVVASQLMVILDGTIVTVALPASATTWVSARCLSPG